MVILNELSAVMKDKKLKDADLASRTGLTVRTIEKARLKQGVSNGTAALIAQYLKITTKALGAEKVEKPERVEAEDAEAKGEAK